MQKQHQNNKETGTLPGSREQIGRVTLDYTWYPGQDLYSDGEVEEQLLEIAMNTAEEDLNAEIGRRKDWSVLYHMSDVRENIAAALPIRKTDRVLEIGAGCGAVTGQLARMAASVTCVDLSRRRSLVNAYRHRNYDNIEILVGNFQDIEKHLTGQFDCVTLIGVFEYAQGYIGTDRPYTEFLRQIRRHLAPGGKIVIAIENRLGLKYWAGCREDHTGNFFEGLENYADGSYVRTFVRPELENIFAEAGFHNAEFYYPYPDYKLPGVIYSDALLPQQGSLHRQLYHFDRDRMTLFNENAVNDSLIACGQYPLFANSYLVILRTEAGEIPASRVVYSKYSVERDPRFAIRTDIEEDAEGRRRVIKRAVTPEARPHIASIAENGRKLEALYAGTPIHINRVLQSDEDAVVLEYVKTESTLEQQLAEKIAGGRQEQAFEEVRKLVSLIRSRAGEPFRVQEGFAEMFGSEAAAQLAEQDFRSASVTDLDMVPENLMIRPDGGWDLIDYEWSCGIPVPVDFVIYRIWHYFLAGSFPGRPQEPLLREEGFTIEDLTLFRKMEQHWQRCVKGSRVTLDELHRVMAPQTVDVRSELMLHETQRGGIAAGNLYYSGDGVFSENRKRETVLKLDADGHFDAVIDLEGLPARSVLRWDPLERRMCRIHIEKTDCPQAHFVPMNGRHTEENGNIYDEFMTVDPAYRIEGDLTEITSIHLEGTLEIIYLENRMQQFEQLRLERDTYYNEMERLRAQIEAIHSTKAYRLLKTVRGIFSKGRQA